MSPESQLQRRKKVVQAYFDDADAFLEWLFLLMHMMGGQPPRGTELMGLQHSNTAQGQHRGVFVEEGLIGTVTPTARATALLDLRRLSTDTCQRR